MCVHSWNGLYLTSDDAIEGFISYWYFLPAISSWITLKRTLFTGSCGCQHYVLQNLSLVLLNHSCFFGFFFLNYITQLPCDPNQRWNCHGNLNRMHDKPQRLYTFHLWSMHNGLQLFYAFLFCKLWGAISAFQWGLRRHVFASRRRRFIYFITMSNLNESSVNGRPQRKDG